MPISIKSKAKQVYTVHIVSAYSGREHYAQTTEVDYGDVYISFTALDGSIHSHPVASVEKMTQYKDLHDDEEGE